MTQEQIEQKAKEIANKMIDFANYSSINTPDEQRNVIASVAKESAIEMADWALSHQWIRVEDELPPPMSKCDPISDRVFVHTSSDCVFVDHYDHYYNEWLTGKRDNNNVTHWMPIPPVVEKGGRNE